MDSFLGSYQMTDFIKMRGGKPQEIIRYRFQETIDSTQEEKEREDLG